MHPLKSTVIAYFVIMHGITTAYAIFVLQTSPFITFLIASIGSLVLLLISSTIFLDNVVLTKRAKNKHYLIFHLLFTIPITLFYYLPVFYSKTIIKAIGYVFPSIAQYLLWLSYSPAYALFIYPQFIISMILTLFVYYYLRSIKK